MEHKDIFTPKEFDIIEKKLYDKEEIKEAL